VANPRNLRGLCLDPNIARELGFGRVAAPRRLLVALQIGCWFIASTAAVAQTSPKVAEVQVTPAQMHQLDIVKVETYPFRVQKSAVGQIAFNEDTSTLVLTPFSGRVTRLIAKVGDNVKRGEPLFEIDSPEVVQPQNDFVAALTGLNKARKQLELAQIAEKRAKDLYEGKAGPLKELQLAQAQLDGAQNDMRAVATALEAARSRLRILGLLEDEVTALQDRGVVRRATAIYAPIDGTVVARKIGPGQYVRSDLGDALYTIADLSTMWLKANVPENEIPLIRVGQEIEVKVTALPDRVIKARIANIGTAFDAATRRVIVRSEIPNPDGLLKSEMFASFKILTGEAQPAPAVPVEAVIWEGDQSTVWIEREPMRFERRAVKVGMEQDGRLQIHDGVRPGELAVARGAIFVDNEFRQ
jgi:cobalt-zinc-cadmium efflux system membrane fusion protein